MAVFGSRKEHHPLNETTLVVLSERNEGAVGLSLRTGYAMAATTPLGLGGARRPIPRVAEYGNPGLDGCNPLRG